MKLFQRGRAFSTIALFSLGAIYLPSSAIATPWFEPKSCKELFRIRDVSQAREKLFEQFRSPSGDETFRPSNVFEATGLIPKDGQTIVISGAFEIGSGVIKDFGKINLMHRMFPNSEILYIGPNASVLRQSYKHRWFKSFTVSGYDVDLSKHIQAGDFLIANQWWNTPITYAQKVGASVISYSSSGRSAYSTGHASLEATVTGTAPTSKFVGPRRFLQQANGLSTVQARIGVRELGVDGIFFTIYEMQDYFSEIIFGDTSTFDRPADMILDKAEDHPKFSEFYATAFPGRASHPFISINLNTAGQGKVTALTPNYTATLQRLLELVQKQYPEANILITPVESQFGDGPKREVENLVSKISERVGFFPADKKLWMMAVAESEFVITQEAGFNHLALMVKNPEDILVISTGAITGKGDFGLPFWRHPKQPFVNRQAKEGGFQSIESWMTSRLK